MRIKPWVLVEFTHSLSSWQELTSIGSLIQLKAIPTKGVTVSNLTDEECNTNVN